MKRNGMTIYGLSPTSGAERTLDLEKTAAGLLIHSRDPESYRDIDRIVVDPHALLTAVIDRPAEQTRISGVTAAAGEASRRLDISVRGNEVILSVQTETDNGWDIAVGFDDFQDALEEASDAG
jgi:hypothetical protein